MTDVLEKTSKKPFITTTHAISGYFAVCIWWNTDMDGFWEPWNTGIGRYATKEEAVTEAKQWAKAEELEYRESMNG